MEKIKALPTYVKVGALIGVVILIGLMIHFGVDQDITSVLND